MLDKFFFPSGFVRKKDVEEVEKKSEIIRNTGQIMKWWWWQCVSFCDCLSLTFRLCEMFVSPTTLLSCVWLLFCCPQNVNKINEDEDQYIFLCISMIFKCSSNVNVNDLMFSPFHQIIVKYLWKKWDKQIFFVDPKKWNFKNSNYVLKTMSVSIHRSSLLNHLLLQTQHFVFIW